MICRVVALASVLTIFGAALSAADVASSKETKAAELVRLAHMDETLRQGLTMTTNQIKSGVMQQMMGVTLTPDQQAHLNEFQDKLTAVMGEVLSWEKLQPAYVHLFAETYSEQELDDLITFYKSPAGRAMVEKTPMLMQRSSEIVQQRMQEMQPQLRKLLSDFQNTPAK